MKYNVEELRKLYLKHFINHTPKFLDWVEAQEGKEECVINHDMSECPVHPTPKKIERVYFAPGYQKGMNPNSERLDQVIEVVNGLMQRIDEALPQLAHYDAINELSDRIAELENKVEQIMPTVT